MIERLVLDKSLVNAGVPIGIFQEHLVRYITALTDVVDKDVLDVASGAGYGMALMSRFAKTVSGFDYSPIALNEAQYELRTALCPFHLGLKNLETDDDFSGLVTCYDTITCFETLEHVANPEFLLKNIKKHLKPGGKLHLSTPNCPTHINGNMWHKQAFSYEDLKRLVDEHLQPVSSLWLSHNQWGFKDHVNDLYLYGIFTV